MNHDVRLRVALVGVQRPIFRGDKAGVWRASIEAVRALAAAEQVELQVHEAPVTDAPEAAALAERLVAAAPDLVLVQATTFATADCFEPLLRTGLPTALWGVPEPELGGPLPLNSLCGLNFVRSLEPLWESGGGQVKWLYGEGGGAGFQGRLGATFKALRARKALEGAWVMWLGGTAPTFARFDYDEDEVLARFGVRVERVALDEWFARAEAVPESVAHATAREMRAEATSSDLNVNALLPAARVDVALRELMQEVKCDAVALRCWPECAERLGAMPCASVARSCDRRQPGACEGDLLGAVSLLALQALAGTAPALLDLSHTAEQGTVFWHCGNAPKSLAAGGETHLATHFNRPETGCVREMRLAPGEATMLRFAGLDSAALFDGRWVDGPAAFDGVSGWFDDIRWEGTTPLTGADLLATVLDRRLPHHFAFAPGRLCEAAAELCAWLGLELVPASRWRDGMVPSGGAADA